MSIIDDIKKYASDNPGVRLWVEEALVRGAPSDAAQFGVVAGAHFVIGIETPNPFGNPTRQLQGPFPASLLPDGDKDGLADLVTLVNATQQQTIDAQAASLTAKDATIQQQTDALAAAQTQITEKDAALTTAGQALVASHAQVIADLQSQLDAAKSDSDSTIAALNTAHAAALADLQSQIDALGGTELAQKLAREAAIEAAKQKRAEAESELVALQPEPTANV